MMLHRFFGCWSDFGICFVHCIKHFFQSIWFFVVLSILLILSLFDIFFLYGLGGLFWSILRFCCLFWVFVGFCSILVFCWIFCLDFLGIFVYYRQIGLVGGILFWIFFLLLFRCQYRICWLFFRWFFSCSFSSFLFCFRSFLYFLLSWVNFFRFLILLFLVVSLFRLCPIWYWCLVFVFYYTSFDPSDVVEFYSDE